MTRARAPLAVIAAVFWLVGVAGGQVSAASPGASTSAIASPDATPVPPGPPFPEPTEGQAVYDYAVRSSLTRSREGGNRSSMPSRRRPRPRSSSTPRGWSGRHHRGRSGGRRQGPDGRVGRRASRDQRRRDVCSESPTRAWPTAMCPALPGRAYDALAPRSGSPQGDLQTGMLPCWRGDLDSALLKVGSSGIVAGRSTTRRLRQPGAPAVRRPAARVPAPGRPVARSTTTPVASRPRRDPARSPRSIRSRAGPGPRSSSTP